MIRHKTVSTAPARPGKIGGPEWNEEHLIDPGDLPQGPKGDPGDQGIQGLKGDKGDKGDAGTTDYAQLQNVPASFPPSAHAHSASEVTGTAILANDARLSDARTPLAHSHSASDVTGTAILANDARLSDARTPTAHSHAIADVTNLQTGLDGKEAANANIQAHVASAHAPSNAQKNSDILQSEIEAKLTGPITTHSHAGQPIGWVSLANDTLAQALATNINTQLTVTANRTLTTTVPGAGTRCAVNIVTSGTVSFTITFGSGFKPTGTLATGTTTARQFILNWVSNGTNLLETGRTAAFAT